MRHHVGVSHIMLPANWYVGSPSAAIEIITTFCGLSSPLHPLLSHQLPSALIKHLILSNYENYEYLTLNRSCLLVLLQKDIFFFQESFVILLDLLNKKEDFFLLRVFLGSCARTSIFSKFTLRKSKKRKAPQTNLTILRCVPHPPRTSGPRQLPCRLRGRRRRGHQGLRDGINLR